MKTSLNWNVSKHYAALSRPMTNNRFGDAAIARASLMQSKTNLSLDNIQGELSMFFAVWFPDNTMLSG
jgi:hypothetical protein